MINVTQLLVLSLDKTGSCPALPGVSPPCVVDVDECFMDYDCVKDKKCCSNGCYTVCVPPAENIIVPAAAGTEMIFWVCLAYVQWKPALIWSRSGHQNLVSTFQSNNDTSTKYKSVGYGQRMDESQQMWLPYPTPPRLPLPVGLSVISFPWVLPQIMSTLQHQRKKVHFL